MGLFKEFREFAMKGNVVDLAVGVIIGAAFGAIVKSMVDDVMMPPLGYLMGGVDFSDKTLVLKDAVAADPANSIKAAPAVIIFYGKFINSVIQFVIVAFCIFLVIKAMNMAKKRFEKEQAAAPAAPPADVVLLSEIRDILKSK
jgi:large conductance mechanosensitive channel